MVEGGARLDTSDVKEVMKEVLLEACSIGRVEVVKYLVEIGADVHARVNGETALTRASNLELVTYLLAIGAEEGVDDALENGKRERREDIVGLLELRKKMRRS